MKTTKVKRVILLGSLLSLFSCEKNKINEHCTDFVSVQVIKDCSGTYLRSHTGDNPSLSDDKLVSNPKILKEIESGTNINVCYHASSEAEVKRGIIQCDLLHEYTSVVKVQNYKP